MSRAVIVAHGQPSDPLPAAAALEALAGRVAGLLPGWEVGTATLAEPGALARAAGRGPGLIYPLFMAAGWFTQTAIPARLEDAGVAGWQVLAPFGCDPAVHGLAVDIVRAAAPAAVLLAAHGSFKSPAPAAVAGEVAARIAAETGLRCAAAFIDQSPRIAEARGFPAGAVCLPFFAMSGGHVETDVPAALAEAGFPGGLLPALGLHPRVPGLIAAALRRAVQ
jgi:sirohydrochlorin ferrochelatase